MSLLKSQLEQLIENARRIKTPEFVKAIEDYSDLFKHHRFRLRPSVNSISLVSCSSWTPQLGFSGITNATVLRNKLEDLKHGKTSLERPGRETPEKALQSWLISQALANGQKLTSIDAALNDGHSYRFVTDEISLRVSDAAQTAADGTRVVADLLLIRTDGHGQSEIVNVELKSNRDMATYEQIRKFRKFMGADQLRMWRELVGIVLGSDELQWKQASAVRGIVVWPAPAGAAAKRTKELLGEHKANDIDTICYNGPLYEFETEQL